MSGTTLHSCKILKTDAWHDERFEHKPTDSMGAISGVKQRKRNNHRDYKKQKKK